MGCDIHMHMECRNQYGIWERVPPPPEIAEWYEQFNGFPEWFQERSYSLFGELAGVRDASVAPISMPKGFPSDASPSVTADYRSWDVDAHNASHLTLSEIEAYVSEGDPGAWTPSGYITDFIIPKMRERMPRSGADDIRIVFWFDN